MTETLKVDLDSKLVKKFKKKAFETYGYKKGSVKKAMEEVLKGYTESQMANWSNLRGILSSNKASSVELQHSIWKELLNKKEVG
jgi:hypothetical protein